MYPYSYNYSSTGQSVVWITVSLILGFIGGICLYVCFVRENRDLKDPRLIKLRDFLQFRTLIIEPVLKCLYCMLAVFITLCSFELIGSSFMGFLFFLVFGNVIARLLYEGSMIVLMIWRNTSEINKKLEHKECECKGKCDYKEEACECEGEAPKAEEKVCECKDGVCTCEAPKEPVAEPTKEATAEKAEEKPKKPRKPRTKKTDEVKKTAE